MKTVVMSDEYPCFCRALAAFGYEIIPSKKIETFWEPEQRHADMQLLILRDRVFTLEDCRSTIGREYPQNVRLNCLLLGDTLYANLRAADAAVLDFCAQSNIRTVHVNQGYTRCSALVLNDRAVITADKALQKALERDGAEVLLIQPGHIRLPGFDHGFIGGASFCDGGTVFCFGNAKKHPDWHSIETFCRQHGVSIQLLCENQPLTDIGGAVDY